MFGGILGPDTRQHKNVQLGNTLTMTITGTWYVPNYACIWIITHPIHKRYRLVRKHVCMKVHWVCKCVSTYLSLALADVFSDFTKRAKRFPSVSVCVCYSESCHEHFTLIAYSNVNFLK